MSAQIIDGKAIAAQVQAEITAEISAITSTGARPPGLGVILVGENPASQAYVRSKTKACKDAGFHSVQHDLPDTITEAQLLDYVRKFNEDPAIDGILVQLPLPKQIRENVILNAIDPDKDADGFHPVNVGRLSIGEPGFVPCTPLGVRELLLRSGVETAGKFAVVIGRSNIVGKPAAALLGAKGKGGDATVCICHSRTKNIAEICRQADIIIAAIGKANFVTADFIKPGAAVIDVGINRVDDATAKRGYRLVGDVDFDAVKEIAGAITPVPGGVGPMTIAMLLKNTLESRKKKISP
ncbi:bifunctional methylenetetrahydrofolate dehydrogenase/methenyltetrahydrofolate cyclohydrolase FolD [soil metagenome]